MISISANLNIMIKAAEKASKSVIRDFGEVEKLQVSKKGPYDFVTKTDKHVEKILIEELSKIKKNYSFITEETGLISGEEETIVIDPIDGTSNFIHGIPHVAIVIGKIVNEQITDGIIYNPILNEFYWASQGKGAWCNNKRIRVSKRQDLNECLIGTGAPFGKRVYSDYYKELEKISKNIGEDLQQMADLTLDPSTSNDGSDIKTNPNRTVGTGTYTPNSVDKNPKVKGYEDTADSATQSGVSTLT